MKFKRTFHILVDNFPLTFKLLLYRIVLFIVFGGIGMAILMPYINRLFDYSNINEFLEQVRSFIMTLLSGNFEERIDLTEQINQFLTNVSQYFSQNVGRTVLVIFGIVMVYLIKRFFNSIGNYTVAAIVNDNMALQAKSPFFSTMIRNLGRASLYSVIYVPLAFLYDAIFLTLGFYIFFVLLSFITFPFSMFMLLLFTAYAVLVVAVKLTWTSDWLPALVVDKFKTGAAMSYTFNYKNKHFLNVFSNFIVYVLLIMAANVGAVILTFGAGILLTVPASYIVLIAFELVNYCDNNDKKYFIDRDTVVRPEHEKAISREQFFKGE